MPPSDHSAVPTSSSAASPADAARSSSPLDVTVVRRDPRDLTAADVGAVLDLTEAAATADGFAPLDEDGRLGLRTRHPDRDHLLVWHDGRLAAYAHLSWPDPRSAGGSAGELVVAPAFRRRGVGRRVLDAALDLRPGAAVTVWAHGDHPGARVLARAAGFGRVRDLWRMRRDLRAPAEPLPEPAVPDGVTVRTFRPGHDDAPWLELNRRAFAAHPEQGRWTADDLAARQAEPWFDPAGFFLAERDGRLIGFHWTKVHPGAGGPPVGEVYVLGVDPDVHGAGLGTTLAVVGLRHLRDRGLDAVMLFVEADSAAAVRLYTRLGFAHVASDVMYRRDVPASRSS